MEIDRRCPAKVRPLLQIAAPCIIEQVLLALVGLISTMIVGRLGNAELTAAGMGNTMVGWLQGMYTGFATSATVVIGRFSDDQEQTKKIFMQAVLLTISISVGVLLLVILFQQQILHLFFGGAEANVMEKLELYFSWCMLGLPATAITNIITSSLRGIGDNKTALYSTAVLNLLNIVFSYILIYGNSFLAIPHMGILGAGIGVTLARYLGMVLVILYIFMKKPSILPSRITLRFHKDTVSRLFRIGIPSAVEQLVFNGGFVVLQILLLGFGTALQAGYQIGANLNGISNAPAMALGIAMTSIISILLGQKDLEGAKEYVKAVKYLIITLFTSLSVIMFFASPFLASLFTNDPEALKHGANFTRLFALLVLPLGYFQAMAGTLRGAGDVKYVAATSIIGLWLMRIITVWILAKLTGNGFLSVSIGISSDFILRAILYHFRVRKENWLYIRI